MTVHRSSKSIVGNPIHLMNVKNLTDGNDGFPVESVVCWIILEVQPIPAEPAPLGTQDLRRLLWDFVEV